MPRSFLRFTAALAASLAGAAVLALLSPPMSGLAFGLWTVFFLALFACGPACLPALRRR